MTNYYFYSTFICSRFTVDRFVVPHRYSLHNVLNTDVCA